MKKQEIISLLIQHKQGGLAHYLQILKWRYPASFTLVFEERTGLTNFVTGKLKQVLQKITATPWKIYQGKEQLTLIERVKKEPLVKQLLALFPGAEIITVQEKKPCS